MHQAQMEAILVELQMKVARFDIEIQKLQHQIDWLRRRALSVTKLTPEEVKSDDVMRRELDQ